MLKWFVDLKISRKLIVGFLIVAFLAAVIGGVGIWNMAQMKQQATDLYELYVLGVQYAEDAARYFERLRYNLTMYAVQDNATGLADYSSRISNQVASIEESLDKYEQLIQFDDEWERYNAVVEYWEKYKPLAEKLTSNTLTSPTAITQRLSYIRTYSNVSDALRDAFVTMIEADAAGARAKTEENNASAQGAILIELVIMLAAILVAIWLGAYISGIIGKPIMGAVEVAKMLAQGDMSAKDKLKEETLQRRDEIGQLRAAFGELIDATLTQVQATERLAKGDLTKDVEIRSDKDILGKSLQTVIDNLNDIATSIIATANQVASGASAISHSSQILSDGATRQASAIEELTASIEEIAAQTENNAKNAQEANRLAAETKESAIRGNEQMNTMLKAMDAINASSANISKVIKVIEDIAFQTNILALNAAVEAARAGQYGRGFAVVAEEVRNLAARSASAAKETTSLIDDSMRKVDAGMKIADETADSLGKIVGAVDEAATLVAEIADASREQANSIAQIKDTLSQINAVVQTNSASAEESAASSEQLAAQASLMKEQIRRFILRSQTASSRAPSQPGKKRALAPARENIRISLGEGDKY